MIKGLDKSGDRKVSNDDLKKVQGNFVSSFIHIYWTDWFFDLMILEWEKGLFARLLENLIVWEELTLAQENLAEWIKDHDLAAAKLGAGSALEVTFEEIDKHASNSFQKNRLTLKISFEKVYL